MNMRTHDLVLWGATGFTGTLVAEYLAAAQTGLSLGTPHYMSPEQAAGTQTVDARSDQYALGAIAYEMLTGEPPHTGPTTAALVARLLTEKPRDIRATSTREYRRV